MRGTGAPGPGAGEGRWAARRPVAAGEVEVVRGGRPVDPARARGPIRIRRTP
ncbi:DUF3253 domain-containing protein [Streptomyces yangpuensis]